MSQAPSRCGRPATVRARSGGTPSPVVGRRRLRQLLGLGRRRAVSPSAAVTRAMPGAEPADLLADPQGAAALGHEPARAAHQQLADGEQEAVCRRAGTPSGRASMAPQERQQAERVAGGDEGEHDLLERRPGLVLELRDEHVEAAIDEAVGEPGGDDLAAAGGGCAISAAEPPPQRAREVFGDVCSAR